jgi:hypothetical protein
MSPESLESEVTDTPIVGMGMLCSRLAYLRQRDPGAQDRLANYLGLSAGLGNRFRERS